MRARLLITALLVAVQRWKANPVDVTQVHVCSFSHFWISVQASSEASSQAANSACNSAEANAPHRRRVGPGTLASGSAFRMGSTKGRA